MLEIKGNYWDEAPKYEALVCTTNLILKKDGCLVMGAGIAKDFRDKFPGIDRIWGRDLKDRDESNAHNRNYFRIMVVEWDNGWTVKMVRGNKKLIAFPTKYDWKDKSSQILIRESAIELYKYVEDTDIKSVLMTRPGCGCGGLNWELHVRPIINFLDDRVTVINAN